MMLVRWRAVVWVAVALGVAAATSLVVDVALNGTGKASGLAGIIVAFCELGALVLGVTAWAAERRTAAGKSSPGRPGRARDPDLEEPRHARPAGSGKYVVDARGVKGLQVGDGNIQRNIFHQPLRDQQSGDDEL